MLSITLMIVDILLSNQEYYLSNRLINSLLLSRIFVRVVTRGATGVAGRARPLLYFTPWLRTCLQIEAQHILHLDLSHVLSYPSHYKYTAPPSRKNPVAPLDLQRFQTKDIIHEIRCCILYCSRQLVDAFLSNHGIIIIDGSFFVVIKDIG